MPEIDSIVVKDRIEVVVHLTSDNSRDVTVDAAADVTVLVRDRVLELSGAEQSDTAQLRPTVSIEVASLDTVSVRNSARVTLTGKADSLKIAARQNSAVDATALQLSTLAVEIEQSSVSASVTNSVTGYVVYGSRLTVSGGADTSTVLTANAGKVMSM